LDYEIQQLLIFRHLLKNKTGVKFVYGRHKNQILKIEIYNIMEHQYSFKLYRLLLIVAMFFIASDLYSQVDVVIMVDGEIKQGKVTAMEESAVKFIHTGEDLEYSFKKTEISKIQFASGRVQTFNDSAQSAPAPAATTSPEERKGKLAVAPVEVITNDPSINPETMGTQIQHEAVNSFKQHSPGMSIQDPRTTSSILSSSNIDQSQLTSMAPSEVAVILGVEFVAYGVVNIENKGTTTTGSGVTTYQEKESNTRSTDRKDTRVKASEVTSASSTTTIEYDCKVELSIYNDQGNNVFFESRDAFGWTLDSYNNGLNYMIRRTPFGDKHK
jgi:hypothetical protein